MSCNQSFHFLISSNTKLDWDKDKAKDTATLFLVNSIFSTDEVASRIYEIERHSKRKKWIFSRSHRRVTWLIERHRYRRCTLQVIPTSEVAREVPNGFLRVHAKNSEKLLNYNSLSLLRSSPTPLPPSTAFPHFALCTFLRAILILTRAAARYSFAPRRCHRCTLIFQKNAHCASSSFLRPFLLALFSRRPSGRAKEKNTSEERKREKKKKEKGGRNSASIHRLVPLARIKHSRLAIALCSRYHRDAATR